MIHTWPRQQLSGTTIMPSTWPHVASAQQIFRTLLTEQWIPFCFFALRGSRERLMPRGEVERPVDSAVQMHMIPRMESLVGKTSSFLVDKVYFFFVSYILKKPHKASLLA